MKKGEWILTWAIKWTSLLCSGHLDSWQRLHFSFFSSFYLSSNCMFVLLWLEKGVCLKDLHCFVWSYYLKQTLFLPFCLFLVFFFFLSWSECWVASLLQMFPFCFSVVWWRMGGRGRILLCFPISEVKMNTFIHWYRHGFKAKHSA